MTWAKYDYWKEKIEGVGKKTRLQLFLSIELDGKVVTSISPRNLARAWERA